jgi:hypothetical protein
MNRIEGCLKLIEDSKNRSMVLKDHINSANLMVESLSMEVTSAGDRLRVLEDKFGRFDADSRNSLSNMKFEHMRTVTRAGAKIIEEVLIKKKKAH